MTDAAGGVGLEVDQHSRLPRLVDYPRGRLFAVVDDPAAAERARTDLLAAGLTGVAILAGTEAADAIDATGRRHGLGGRLIRAVQFLVMDQMPDLAWYEAALRDGRAVVTVATPDRETGARAAAVLVRHGGHFVNRFGRFETEQIERWHGPEPTIPRLLRR